jgi:hypothetical protein
VAHQQTLATTVGIEWDKIQAQGKRSPDKIGMLVTRFRDRLCRKGVFASLDNVNDDARSYMPRWILAGPMAGFIFQVH